MTKQTEAHAWICRIIDTCNHQFHFEAVENLISLYRDIYRDIEGTFELRIISAKKFNEIHKILM
jgi:hypothetical protein